MLNFLHTFTPHPIFLTVGGISIYWYGLILGVTILLGYGLASKLARQQALDRELISTIYTNLVIWGFIGARLYHVLGDWFYYWQNPVKIIAVWEGGLAIHGAIMAGAITLYYYARQRKIDGWALADLFSLPLILGQALGRWGNYFNQELFGQPTNLPWGIPIAIQNRPPDFINYDYFHPTFLYESLWDFFVLGIIYYLWYKKITTPNPFPRNTRDMLLVKEGRKEGLVFWTYLTLYSVGRLLTETLRINQTPMVFGYRWPALFSLGLLVIGAVMILKKWRGRRDSNP